MKELEQQRFRDNIDQLLGHLEDTKLRKPPISPRYSEIAAKLLILDKEGVRAFNGGPLDFRGYGMEKSWLIPAEVEDKKGYTNFHILYLNCTPSDAHGVPVEFSYARTVGLKVGDIQDPLVRKLHGLIMGGDTTPRIIVRPSLVGMLYYPKITTPLDIPSPDILARRITQLSKVLNLNFDTEELDKGQLTRLTRRFNLYAQYSEFVMGAPEAIYSEAGLIYMYPIISPDDPWKYFQLFTTEPLKKIDKLSPVILRTDSGCDIGQLYRDLECDCRDQLITALKKSHRKEGEDPGGIVVHLPTQDGRGYGMNTKMETEGLKRGMRMVFNRQDETIQPLDTVEAGQKVFDENYDARTYDGAARILYQIGFRSVIVYTDNIDKAECLSRGGLEVERRPTGTKGNEFNNHHIRAKHRTEKYFHTD